MVNIFHFFPQTIYCLQPIYSIVNLFVEKSLNVNIAFCQNDPFLENVFGQLFFLQTANEGTYSWVNIISVELPRACAEINYV